MQWNTSLLTLLFGLFYSTSLAAQAGTDLQRTGLTLTQGFSLLNSSCREGCGEENYVNSLTQFTLEYRLRDQFSLLVGGGLLSHSEVNASQYIIVSETTGLRTQTVGFVLENKSTVPFLGLGGQFNLPLGRRGEISAGGMFRMAAFISHAVANSVLGEKANLDYQTQLGWSASGLVAYTYWPTRSVGLKVMLTTEHYTPFTETLVTTSPINGRLEEYTQTSSIPEMNLQFFHLGLTFRL